MNNLKTCNTQVISHLYLNENDFQIFSIGQVSIERNGGEVQKVIELLIKVERGAERRVEEEGPVGKRFCSLKSATLNIVNSSFFPVHKCYLFFGNYPLQ